MPVYIANSNLAMALLENDQILEIHHRNKYTNENLSEQINLQFSADKHFAEIEMHFYEWI